jgi:hypothetical protein
MSCFLVTGGAGFIGSHLVRALLDEGDTVRVLDDLSSGHRKNVPHQVELIEADVTDPAAVEIALYVWMVAFTLPQSLLWLAHILSGSVLIKSISPARSTFSIRRDRRVAIERSPLSMPRPRPSMGIAVASLSTRKAPQYR